MSRTDSCEFDHPPGSNGLQINGNNDREQLQTGYYASVAYSSQDRRPSGVIPSQAAYASVPRSLGMQERLDIGPNRHNPNSNAPIPSQPFSSFNHHHPRHSSPSSLSQTLQNTVYSSATFNNDRDTHIYRHPPHNSNTNTPPLHANSHASRCTLWWGEIEPWMDEEYAKQVCTLMGWDPVGVKVPHPAPDAVTGQQANNPGYCFLTFGTPAHAASVLAQINNSGSGNSIAMPNSTKPFVLNWASAVPSVSPISTSFPPGAGPATGSLQQYPKEYSIFVGDLAPETSNSDLVAVFRNPVLGLRNDREPKFIRPFLSCKSAKIMLDPVTGVSRGYGFVRFTDEADQQRALIEMHGLYCLSRPMRISPATAKFKPPPVVPSTDLPQVQFPPQHGGGVEQPHPVTIALPLPHAGQTKSVSVPIATATSNASLGTSSNGVSSSHSGTSIGASNSSHSLGSGTGSSSSLSSSAHGGSVTSEEMMNLPNSVLAQIAQQYASGEASPIKVNNGANSITPPFAQDVPGRQSLGQAEGAAPRYTISEESWKHHAQARAILGNLIGPNGEQLTSTDPYNTTVFVGGLSPLISEETLRTFFVPFGDIHYVKVPVGKHCGFVQFVRKADAERAIEKMQGFPIGGSRIRLSWGRSQYKAAQAAAQAAQATALQSQFSVSAALPGSNMMSQEQAIQLLQKLNLQGYFNNTTTAGTNCSVNEGDNLTAPEYNNTAASIFGEHNIHPVLLTATRDEATSSYDSFSSNAFFSRPEIHRSQSQFAPFSPDPNAYVSELKSHDSRVDILPHPSKAYAPGFYPLQTQDLQVTNTISKTSPTSARPASASASASRYNALLEGSNHQFSVNRVPGRPEAPVSRPASGQTVGSATRMEQNVQELDAMHDLNGTLASLELDRPWKSPTGGTGSGPASRLTNEKASSP